MAVATRSTIPIPMDHGKAGGAAAGKVRRVPVPVPAGKRPNVNFNFNFLKGGGGQGDGEGAEAGLAGEGGAWSLLRAHNSTQHTAAHTANPHYIMVHIPLA